MRNVSGVRMFAWSVIALTLGILSIASLLPLLGTDWWLIRMMDFPRLQFLFALIIVLPATLLLSPKAALSGAAGLIGVCAITYNIYKLASFTPPAVEVAATVVECSPGSRVRVLVANVHRGNEGAEELIEIIRKTEPDLFLAVETDEWWDMALRQLEPIFAEKVQQVAGARSYFGMHLFSKFRLLDTKILFPVGDHVPAIKTAVRLPGGETISFYGIHPRPPGLFQSSTMRDAQLLSAGLAARETDIPTVLAGDFNAVPWDHVFSRTLRTGGLLDPRIGRGFMPTFSAQNWLMSWPLDHILFTEEIGLMRLQRLPSFGSDHYPLLTDLCHMPSLATVQEAPGLESSDVEEAEAVIRMALEGR
ncbi:endonuclease/exonuclease/phosphatase (EEP) superfamily protein YafD [Rhodoligotrophos appendicifer]|uniref:endonuclease/exonuclease/phosphatase family protein n=1 Tax=Rhodoligotrophos appendicifer TaxID=987056 RepID=UPI001185E754|nr:endonuclease/exonuclease/phosphatase family protein [Rhodoligotrophos appendicifer]